MDAQPPADQRRAISSPAQGRAVLLEALTRAEAALQLSAGVAHDVRNALQVVLGCADLLCHDTLSPEQSASARDIHQAATHALAVLRDFITMARPSATAATAVDTPALVRHLRPMVHRVARSGVECLIEVEPDAWPVSVEPQQLQAVLLNLCANARDAMPDGGRLSLSVRNVTGGRPPVAGRARDQVAFSVHDSGAGMSREVLERATEAFFSTKAGGTGLGLALAQEFATRCGGTLRIDSTVGAGTTVELRLPRAIPRAAADATAADRRDDIVHAMRRQIRTPWLRDVLDAWHRACGDAMLPSPLDVDVAVTPHAAVSIVVLTGAAPGRLTLLRIGSALQDALAAASHGEDDLATALSGTLGDVYRQAAATRSPAYERVRYAFSQGPPAEFERLVMPAGTDRQTASHLIGIVTISDPGHS